MSSFIKERLGADAVLAAFEEHKGSQAYPVFEELLNHWFTPFSGDPLPIYQKDKDLPVLIFQLMEKREFPLVDKASRLVFVPSAHEALRAILYCLYKDIHLTSTRELFEEQRDLSDLYTDEGMGYHWTSMPTFGLRPRTEPLVSRSYKPTREDKEAWLMVNPSKSGL